MRIPLALAIAVLLLATTFLAGYFALEQTALIMGRQVEESALRHVARNMTRLQGTLERELRNGLDESRAEISAMGSDANVSLVLFVDDKDRILAATRFDTIGRPIEKIPTGILPQTSSALSSQFHDIRAGMIGKVQLSGDRQSVTAIFPLSLGTKFGELRPSRVGILYEKYDLKRLKAAAYRNVHHQMWNYAFFLVGLACFVWIAFHLALTRRIGRIVSATERFAAGDLDARTGVSGADEIGRLARAFDDMAAKLQSLLSSLMSEIDQRIRLESRLRESGQKFRGIFDQTFQLIGLMTRDGTLTAANKTALDLAGVSESDVLNRPFWETPWWKHSGEMRAQLRQAVKKAAQGEFVRFEATHPTADGSLRYVDFSIKPVLDDTGNVVFLIPEGRDITDRKVAEENLKQHRDHLEELVSVRTGELQRQTNILVAINRIFHETIACETDVEVASVFLDVALELTGTRFGLVSELNAEETLDAVMLNKGAWDACDMPTEKAVKLLRHMEPHGYWGQVLGTGRGLMVNDPESNPHRRGVPEGHVPILRFLGVPLRDTEKIIGLIGLANKETDYTEDDRASVEALVPAFVEALNRKRVEMERGRLFLELRDAIEKVKTLRGLLPICSSCKKIRDDKGYWTQLEVYLSEHSDTEFTHGLCPECAEKMRKDFEEVAKLKEGESLC
jgi:PAS domain S-box-containing protein